MRDKTKAMWIVVKRPIYDQFLDGTKTVEYRRHRGAFTARAFPPGRPVKISYQYGTAPTLDAAVVAFNVVPRAELPDNVRKPMVAIYGDGAPDDEFVAITLDVNRKERPRHDTARAQTNTPGTRLVARNGGEPAGR